MDVSLVTSPWNLASAFIDSVIASTVCMAQPASRVDTWQEVHSPSPHGAQGHPEKPAASSVPQALVYCGPGIIKN